MASAEAEAMVISSASRAGMPAAAAALLDAGAEQPDAGAVQRLAEAEQPDAVAGRRAAAEVQLAAVAVGRGRPARAGVAGALDAPPVPVDEPPVRPVVASVDARLVSAALPDAPQVWTAS